MFFFIDTFEQSFLCFFQLLNTSIHTAIFYKGFIAVSGSAKNECRIPSSNGQYKACTVLSVCVGGQPGAGLPGAE